MDTFHLVCFKSLFRCHSRIWYWSSQTFFIYKVVTGHSEIQMSKCCFETVCPHLVRYWGSEFMSGFPLLTTGSHYIQLNWVCTDENCNSCGIQADQTVSPQFQFPSLLTPLSVTDSWSDSSKKLTIKNLIMCVLITCVWNVVIPSFWHRFHRCWAPVWMRRLSSTCRATCKRHQCSWFESDKMVFIKYGNHKTLQEQPP